MPIGIGTAIGIGAGVLGAGASIYASSKASSAQKSAANTASNDQLAVSQENNQLARDMYNANASRLDPYSTMGLAAGDEYQGLLLGPAASHASNGWAPVVPSGGTSAPGTTPTTPAYSGPSLIQIMAMQHDGIAGNYAAAMAAYNAAHQGGDTPLVGLGGSALAPFAGSAPPSGSALSPVVTQQAQQAIAAGANPQAVAQRAASYGVRI